MSLRSNGRTDGGAPRRLRITFVLAGRSLHGGDRVIVTYGNRLIDRGHEVTIACLRRPLPRRPKALAHRLYAELVCRTGLHRDHVHDFRGRVLSARPEDLDGALPDADAVLATFWLTARPVAGLSDTKGRKYYFLQGYEVYNSDPARVEATWRLPMRKIVISRWLDELARTRFCDPGAVLIPNGVEARLFNAPPRGMHVPPAVGLVYSPDPIKGVEVAFEAIRLVRREYPRLRVVSFGAKRPTRALPLPTDSVFHLRPAQCNIAGIFACADVWLCASTTEGFGLPALEAMACRCPVVCTRCGGPADFVDDGVNGFLVDVGDAKAMAQRILTLLSDPARWEAMSAAAYQVRYRFDWDRSADLLEEALAC